jgi:two-component system, sensor histidine kinase and response regulator
VIKKTAQISYKSLVTLPFSYFSKYYNKGISSIKNVFGKRQEKKVKELTAINEKLKLKILELDKIAINLEERNRQREQLLEILSHDVHSPLRFSTMVGKAVLTRKEDLNKEEIIDALKDINQTGIRVLLLISNVLKWVEYQKGNYSLQFTKENLHQLVQDKLVFFQFIATNKNIHLINNVPLHIFITTDKTAFGVIIQNLINNAVKFTSNGEINIAAQLDENFVTISVTDTGKGMAIETIKAIKDNLSVTPLSDTENFKGNGLGWRLIKDMLDGLDGIFEIKSSEGKGSTIKITLPVAKKN